MGGENRAVRHVTAGLTTVVLVCRKCSKKIDGGFGADGDMRLARLLKRVLSKDEPSRKARARASAVIEVGCLDLCPKNAVVVLRADRPDDWVVVPKGTPVTEVMEHLGLSKAGSRSL